MNRFRRVISRSGFTPLRCSVRSYTPRRALLYVPGDDMKKLQKALTLKVDCIAMDCEDGVAVNKKDVARQTISKLISSGPVSTRNPEWAVRINSVDSGLCLDDLTAILGNEIVPPTILLPKVETPEHIKWLANSISNIIKERARTVCFNLIMYIESARAILKMPEICDLAQQLSASTPLKPVGLVFGSDDLCASLGVTRSEDGAEMMYARQKLVLVAKAYNLQAIDMVHIQYKDLEGLKRQSEIGSRLGFTGKQVIHPGQVSIVQTAFSPNIEQVKWAQKLVVAFKNHQEDGKGAFVFRGQMIDMPLLRQAQNILKLAEPR